MLVTQLSLYATISFNIHELVRDSIFAIETASGVPHDIHALH